jgi:serine/threonine-protein kinase
MTVYNGRYELSNQVARGGTAQVYLARDLLLDRPVALKVLFPELSTDPSFVERFRREAQAAANLSHPNIVPVFDWGQSESTYFIVMEFVDGEALSAIIRTQAPLEQTQSASIASDIAKALSFAHRHGVVHRDVKPGNVLITSDGQVKVTDFGIARAMGSDEQVTQTGLVMGTATYFSPEQAQGLEVDGRSDIYSLGVVLYEMLTGKPPFTGETPVAIAYQHVRENPAAPRTVNPAISTSLEAIVFQAMAKLPAERYQTADEFRADLDRYVRGQTVLARPPSEVTSSLSTTTVQPAVAAGVGGAGFAATESDDRQPPPRPPRRKRTTPYWAAAGVTLLLLIALATVLTARSLGYLGGEKYFHVPHVIGMSAGSATAALDARGLVVDVRSGTATSPADAHTVISESPDFPTDVRKGDTVTITVAGDAPASVVPNVIGRQSAVASRILRGDKFQVHVKSVPFKIGEKQGTVTAQSPSADTSRAVGSTVTISVIAGAKTVQIPPLLASNAVAAISLLTKDGFAVNTSNETQYSNDVPEGNVVATDPPGGTTVAFGSQVTLVLSGGPGATAPIITYREPASQAFEDITSAGLHPVQESIPTTNPNVANLVRKACLPTSDPSVPPSIGACQDASGVANLAPGSTIYLYVWTLPGNTGVGNSGTAGTTATTTTTTTTPGIPPAALGAGLRGSGSAR